MKRIVFTFLALVLANIVAYAQQPGPKPSIPTEPAPSQSAANPATLNHLSNGSTVIFFDVPWAGSCPIGMHARQGSAMQMLRANDGSSQPLTTPTLTLTPPDGRVIVAATITVYGRAPRKAAMDLVAHFVDKDHPAAKADEITKTVSLKLHDGGGSSMSGQLMLAGFSAVESLELNSITYSDGATWKLAPESGCHVAPDPLLLIGGR